MNLRKIFCCIITFLLVIKSGAQEGWTPLFDGKTLAGWKQLGGAATYAVENGEIVGTSVLNTGNSFLATEAEYGDFVLELEIFIEGADNNSGVQTRSHYNAEKGFVFGRQAEVDPTPRRWTGGIYDEARRKWLYPMSLNPAAQAAFKTGAYNKLKIECIGAEMKTWVNGVPAAYVIDTVDKKGFIALQVHAIGRADQAGWKTKFRNIRMQTANLKPTPFAGGIYVTNLLPNTLSPYEKRDGWKLLFDGKSSTGWKGAYQKGFPQKGWQIKEGELQVQASEGAESTNGGDIVTTVQYGAFDLSFDFKLTPGANSGVKYFVTLTENNKGSAIGLEYQVLDDALHPDAKMGRDGNRTLSSLYDLMKAEKPGNILKPIGEWNTGRVVVYPGGKVEHYLNGAKVLEYIRGSQAFRDLVAISKYKVWKGFGEATKGHILLQDHGNAVAFRSIKMKELK